jgi:regulator of protease activity HflC (stomatin/prohibitin superfamily)
MYDESSYDRENRLRREQAEQQQALQTSRIKKGIKIAVIAIALIIAYAVQPFTYENIDAGNVGIKLNLYGSNRGVDKISIVSGRVWYNTWTTRIVEFPTFVQNVDYKPFAINTVDAARFEIDTKMQYRVLADSVPKIYTTFRAPLADIQGEGRYIQTAVYDSFKSIVPKYTSDSLMSRRAQFETEVEVVLKYKLAMRGIVLEQLTSNITPPESMAQAIEAKNSSIQAKLAAENQAKQAVAEATVIKARAEGEATATLVKARAEAEANKLKQATLTPLLVEMERVRKWNGQYPTTMLGSGANTLINLK